jgi:hypothetical protein
MFATGFRRRRRSVPPLLLCVMLRTGCEERTTLKALVELVQRHYTFRNGLSNELVSPFAAETAFFRKQLAISRNSNARVAALSVCVS